MNKSNKNKSNTIPNSHLMEGAVEDEVVGYEQIVKYNSDTLESIASKYKSIIKDIGENPEREGLLRTPIRVARSLQFLTHGYDLKPNEILKNAPVKEEVVATEFCF